MMCDDDFFPEAFVRTGGYIPVRTSSCFGVGVGSRRFHVERMCCRYQSTDVVTLFVC